MIIKINRHKCVRYPQPGGHVDLGIGEKRETYTADVHAVPRVDELVTFHPDGEPSALSWTGRVTGVQHVYGMRSSNPSDDPRNLVNIVLTVREDS